MALHEIYGRGPSFLLSNDGGNIEDRLLYVNSTGFGIQNADGTRTYFVGTGIVFDYPAWDPTTKIFTAGSITTIAHYDANGLYIDSVEYSGPEVTGNLSAIGSWLRDNTTVYAFSGEDVIDARVRVGNAIINDNLFGFYSSDTIYGGSGNDALWGGSHSDTLWGGTGNDRLIGDDQLVYAAEGADTLNGEAGTDTLYGGTGADNYNGGDGTDTAVFWGAFADLGLVKTATGWNVTQLDGKVATLTGIEKIGTDDGIYTYNATTNAWAKTSSISGAALAFVGNVQNGTTLDDVMNVAGTSGVRVVEGKAGNDTITIDVSTFHEVLARGGSGNDTIAVSNTFMANPVRFYGDTGNDILKGSQGSDVLNGGAGNDTLNGGPAVNSIGDKDYLTGGANADTFIFTATSYTVGRDTYVNGWGNDIITDFVVGVDKLRFEGPNTGITVADTADGLLVSMPLPTPFGGFPPGALTYTSVLLEGLHGSVTLAMLI